MRLREVTDILEENIDFLE